MLGERHSPLRIHNGREDVSCRPPGSGGDMDGFAGRRSRSQAQRRITEGVGYCCTEQPLRREGVLDEDENKDKGGEDGRGGDRGL